MENSETFWKGQNICLCFTHNFLHTDFVGVSRLSQWVSNWVHYFQEETNAIFFVLCMPEVRSKYHAMQPGTGWCSCALARRNTCDLLSSKYRQILHLDVCLPCAPGSWTWDPGSCLSCSVAQLCSKLWYQFIPKPVPTHPELGTGAPREWGAKSWRPQKPFCIIKSQDKDRTCFEVTGVNSLQNVPNTSQDMAEMAAEHAKGPAPSFFKPKETHLKIYTCMPFKSWTKISFSFPQAQISGSRERSYQEIIWSPEFWEALSCTLCLLSVLRRVIISQ